MDTNRYFTVLIRGWWIIAITALLGAGAALAYTETITPTYTAKATLLFQVKGSASSPSDLLQGSAFTQNQLRSYALLAYLPVVLQPTIEDLGRDSSVGELKARISTDIPADTALLDIMATSDSPTEAADIANAVAVNLKRTIKKFSQEEAGSTQSARVVAAATPPTFASAPSRSKNAIAGFALGAAIGIILVLLRELLDNKVRDESDVKALTNAPVLGTIGNSKETSVLASEGPSAESLRRLRTSLQFMNVDANLKTIVITSSVPSEGKTTIALGLAQILTETANVLLIDADLRRPRLAEVLGIDNTVGLTSVLTEGLDIEDAIQRVGRSSLAVLTAGASPPNPSEMLGSEALKQLLRSAGEHYDIVILDSAPVLPVSDTTVLAGHVDGTLLVVNAKKSHRKQATQAMKLLETTGGRVLGVVLNQAHDPLQKAHGYGYSAKSDTGAATPTA